MSSLFVASIGNPAPYERTLHSAGHVLLRALASHLEAPPFNANPRFKDGQTTETSLNNPQKTPVTLWQSPTYMNTSGPTLVRAYKKWLMRESLSPLIPPPITEEELLAEKKPKLQDSPQLYRPRLNLVLVQDMLDVVPGQFKVQYGGAERSSRGHRGVESVVEALVKEGLLKPPLSDVESKAVDAVLKNPSRSEERRKGILQSPVLLRALVGIGSPSLSTAKGRLPRNVSNYVLQDMGSSHYARTCAQSSGLALYLERNLRNDF